MGFRPFVLPLVCLLIAAIAGTAWLVWPISVTTQPVSRGSVISAIYATGVVEPTVTLPIAPRQSGHLIDIPVDEGQQVQKGQMLARLNDSDLEGTVKEMTARSDFARSYFQRMKTLADKGLAAMVDLDRAKSDLAAADAALARARSQRDFMTLTSPADGTIIKRDGEIGQYIAAGQAVFHLACCAPLRVTTQIDEEDIPNVHVGQSVVLRSDALPNQVFSAEVIEITPKGDPVARSYRVRLKLNDQDLLKIGMTLDVNLIAEHRTHTLLIPTIAIDSQKVWTIVDGKLHLQNIVTGIHDATQTEVISGLDEGDIIVTSVQNDLREGRYVRLHSTP